MGGIHGWVAQEHYTQPIHKGHVLRMLAHRAGDQVAQRFVAQNCVSMSAYVLILCHGIV